MQKPIPIISIYNVNQKYLCTQLVYQNMNKDIESRKELATVSVMKICVVLGK